MKKTIPITIFALIMMAVITMAENPSGVDLKVTLLSHDPDPVEPGNYADLSFKIENWGTRAAEQTIVELLPQYPFSLDPGTDPQKAIGNIPGLQFSQNAVIVKYRVRVDENAVDGKNLIKIRYKISTSDWITPEAVNVSVQSKNIILGIVSVKSSPQQLPPGKIANVSIILKNFASSYAKDIAVKADLSGLPLAPLQSTENVIKNLGAGQEATTNFEIAANSDAETKIYQIPVKISYFDRTGKNYTKNDVIGLSVGTQPDIMVIAEDSGYPQKGKVNTISVKIINKGPVNAKFLTASLASSGGYSLLSPDTVYIGDLNSDDFDTADFKLYINKDNEILLPLAVAYSDSNNAQYENKANLKFKVYSDSELRGLGLGGANYTGLFIVMLIVASGLFAYFRFRRRKK